MRFLFLLEILKFALRFVRELSISHYYFSGVSRDFEVSRHFGKKTMHEELV